MAHKEALRDAFEAGLNYACDQNAGNGGYYKNFEEWYKENTDPPSEDDICPYEVYAVFCIECDRQGIKPVKHKDFLNLNK